MIIRKYGYDLKKLASLRNIIVHKQPNKIIAEPTEFAVKQIQHIKNALISPPRVFPKFSTDVKIFDTNDSIASVVEFMYSNSYSQVPIYCNSTFKGLLTTNTVSQWLGSCVKDDIFSLKDTSISQVLQYAEDKNNYKFISKNFNLSDIVDVFDKLINTKGKYEAILITENGNESESILGIMTIWDLPKINELINT